ncbi:probable inactive receptor kinase At2g26730 [Nicotiana tomentosiformis]|uniref:probable inactive receptor kinase At2g26730 n=1 Tax=Nicotiana tomentosiformis TaxID=4098 RepID=UPI00051BAB29|nr:probable inactive receptor kinase At2g26730 isoform X1 [Nicotiana tomentosiformis]
MGSSHIFTYYVILLFIVKLCTMAIAQDGSANGFDGAEREALVTIKADFNNPKVLKSWTGLMCYLNNTPSWFGISCINGRVTGLRLQNLGLIGKLKPDALVNLTQLQTLSFKNNSISGNLMDFSKNKNLKDINLSGNRFDGEISPSLLTLNLLESLQVQNNNLNGPIPGFNQSTLKVFNVSYNNLSGEIPNTTALQKFGTSSYLGNQDLCGPLFSITTCTIKNSDTSTPGPSDDSHNDSSNNSKSSMWTPILIVINVVGMVVLLFLFIYYFKKSKKLKKMLTNKNMKLMEVEKIETSKMETTTTTPTETRSVESRSVGLEVELEKGKLIFLGSEINFELDHLLRASAEGLGKGNFGNCYKAMLVDGPTVVVKRLRDLKPLTNEEFVRQVRAIADQKHPNLLPLLGYYNTKDEKLFLLKFAPNGSLYNRIHGGKGTRDRIPFRWSSRLSVARGVARALEHLHLNCSSSQAAAAAVVPHGNLKSSNVLLDENDDVRVADYGLTSLIALPIATQRMVSYRSPEYLGFKKVSKKSDIWSFGCLLLELLTGRISSHSAPPGVTGADLCSWVHRAVREEWTAEIFDTEIAVQRSANSGMLRLLQIAIRCCDKSPEKRPEMSEVVREVESVKGAVDSEDEEDLSLSMDQSMTDDSIATATPSR